MKATARFERPIRPDRIEVSPLGYIAAAILLSDFHAARAGRQEARPSATVHRLVPRRARPRPLPAQTGELRRLAEA
ncbi:hypothetical protein DK419_26310 [Methylobacterium terrae]|uniref:Uncharacterized protein n=1 Tax=Methylobacterium terrae TaxID=2202827 RepID=A0A2U8WVY3_9HYPH|nr:hypothetical protein [Methylobacterium terrae]AWN49422.1 hypothetical protein DK419_26310 [Methylobacterium terrae]